VRVLQRTFAVHEPVVYLELNPRCREDVEDLGGLKLVTGEEFATDGARIRHHQVLGVGHRFGQRQVSSEPGAGGTHHRTLEIVVCAIRRSSDDGFHGRRPWAFSVRGVLGVVQILPAEAIADLNQPSGSEKLRQLVPFPVGHIEASRRAPARLGPLRAADGPLCS
jgi:hypothetical protein